MSLSYAIGVGSNHYVACAITSVPIAKEGDAGKGGDPLTSWSALFATEDHLPDGGVVVSVPVGAPALMAALRDAAGNVPSGVIVNVTQPDGTLIATPTEPFDEKMAVTVVGGSVVNLLVLDPQPGDWRINIESIYSGTQDYGLFFSTVPSADAPATIDSTLSKMADPAAVSRLSALAGLESLECFWCKIGCYALGVVIAAIATVGITVVTAGTAAPAAIGILATFLGVSATIAGGLVAGAITAVAASAAIAASYICSWANVCPVPSSANGMTSA